MINTQVNQDPSFSSSLLDQIYHSIDVSSGESIKDSSFYGELTRRQRRISKNSDERAKLGEKENWVEKKMTEKTLEQKNRRFTAEYDRKGGMVQRNRRFTEEFDRKSLLDNRLSRYACDYDHDALFLDSTSSSSDSKSSLFSSSDTESTYDKAPKNSSSFALPRSKPVRTGASERKGKRESKKQSNLYRNETGETLFFDDYGLRTDTTPKKSKTRAMKIYDNLKKMKQPMSPGGKFASFINSLFTATNTKKSSANARYNYGSNEKSQIFVKRGHVSTCSSVSSVSRSCFSKNSPSSLRNGISRSVRFDPVSAMLEEEYKNEKIMRSPARTNHGREISGRCWENELIMRNVCDRYEEEEEDEDDDGMSCSSSELFELDLVGRRTYMEELPVYETTYVETNRAIANGLIL